MNKSKEVILKRDCGKMVKIIVNISDYSGLDWFILICEKGKSKWISPADTETSYHRNLDMKERRMHIKKLSLEFVSKEEILTAKLSLWNDIKPNLEMENVE